MPLPAEQLQRVYDQVLRQVEAATPPRLMTPAARQWLAAMRRRRWAMLDMQLAAPSSSSAAAALSPPPPPPPPPPGDDPADGGTDSPVAPPLASGGTDDAAAADLDHGGPGDGTDTTDGGGDPVVYRALVEVIRSDGGGRGGGGGGVDAAFDAAAVASSQMGVVAAPPVSGVQPMTLAFGSGPLANYWQAYKETWSQTDGIIRADTNASGHGVLANTSLLPTGLFNVNARRPNGGNNNFGPAAFLSINAAGQVSGYAAIYDGINVTIYRIDADVWTALAAGAFGAWIPGALFTLQRNGTTWKAFNNGVNKATAVDGTYAAGFAGLASAAVGNFTDSWSVT